VSEASATSALGWFASIFALSVGLQIVRLMQGDPGMWLVVDYTLRAIVLLLIALSPLRSAVFRGEPLRVSRVRLLTWMLGAGAAVLLLLWVGDLLRGVIPYLRFGHYPYTTGLLHLFDLTFGLALVAIHEELFFRRFARIAFRRLGDGFAMILATSVIFGFYHWWAGLPNILVTMVIGALLMQLYRVTGALWPAMVIHYFVDLYEFA
jgi:membrane protease YdiL (CAAX protease family)